MSNPYSPFTAPQTHQPPPPSATGKILLAIFGTLGVCGLLCCGACGGLGIWAMQESQRDVAEQVVAEFGQHPLVVEHLGGIDSCQPNLAAGIADDEYEMVFDVRGPRGSGTIRVVTVLDEIIAAQLKTKAGQWELDAEDMPTTEAPTEAVP
ncbi:MAG: hypothetical protein SFU86_10535 [Pirellulaceae bacterium]|nr:hypothetical protein [Pirellulaceae bacterium]